MDYKIILFDRQLGNLPKKSGDTSSPLCSITKKEVHMKMKQKLKMPAKKSNFWCKPKQAKQFALTKIGKKGQMGMEIMVGLLMAFIIITMLIALIPGFVEMIGIGQNSDGLNCKGYIYNGNANDPLSYNATIGEKSTVGCLAIKLYIPYLVLGVLLAVVGRILYSRASQPIYQ